MDGEAGWWTTSGNIGLPPLARVMGVGRQQQTAAVSFIHLSGIPDKASIFTAELGTIVSVMRYIKSTTNRRNKSVVLATQNRHCMPCCPSVIIPQFIL